MKPLIFSGTSNLPLSQSISSILKIPLGRVEIIRFADSESRVRIMEDVEGRDVYVIQSFSDPVDERVIEFLLMGDAVKRGEARRVIAVVPYHGYARQDRIHRSGESLSAHVISKIIECSGYYKIITCELHNEAILGFFEIPVVRNTRVTTL